MKKLPLIALIAALAAAPVLAATSNANNVANGGFNGPGTVTSTPNQSTQTGGFSGPNNSETTVAKALDMSDDSWVILRGNIVKQLDNKHYEFTDGTGSITLEISPKRWNGVNVTPTDKIEIRGKIDKDWNSREVEVKQVQIIK
ncbi:YgiW/YdeI family stress tolerance OB fold protein [Providencia sp.]|uniref:YgiW/YdeI family stress tolerance OB fold protein n=1 Tax=Providencia sp. TaxID=589 RepID=UPI000E92D569|nr:NirD/YgiW/YdeI family stress tolerance protein [Providencia sp.]MBP6082566.1 YgiW/YdeI family stress tolerance OB fold protein [Providencia sp.]HBO22236.1 TIGR00156 family protein [Providencia sp.]